MQKVRVRFAPSPTGHLHIGGARSAIFNWLFARNNDGVFLVRIEDTDVERSKQEYVDSILDSLKWLDLMPDEPIVYQSSLVSEHKKVVNALLEKGLAYPCFCEPKATKDKLKDLGRGVATKYDGTCRDKAYTQEDLKKPHAIRFKLPESEDSCTFDDMIRGEITVNFDQLDDFVIWRRGDMPTYNFCVVVDDISMEISHVIRGEDHISNTPKQILLYKALGEKVPRFAHLPLILGQSGGKLSKRDAAVSVVEYKKQGFLADALYNYLVRLGWSHGDQEIFSKEELVQHFSLDHVGKKGAIFDVKKLSWLNGVYIRNLSYKDFEKALSELNNDKLRELTTVWKGDMLRHPDGGLETLFGLYKERATSTKDLVEDMISLASFKTELDLSLIDKWVSDKTKKMLTDFLVEGAKEERPYIEVARKICGDHEEKLVAMAQPLRLAITGKVTSPGIFELLGFLSWEEVKRRIQNLIDRL